MADENTPQTPQDTQQARERLAVLEERDRVDAQIVEAEARLQALKDRRKQLDSAPATTAKGKSQA